jgi:hypothetical protein
MKKTATILLALLLFSCNHITRGDDLSASEVAYIKSLGILDSNENIIKFYSNYTFKNAGNFFTDKRVAKYWITEEKNGKNKISSAFYQDIKSIDTFYNVDFTFCPYMKVTKLNGKYFEVCADGSKAKIKRFFEEAMEQWRRHK